MAAPLQIYTDGSFDVASRMGGWAFVVHDGSRQLHAASGKATGTSNNTFEVLAVLEAMSWVVAEAPHGTLTLWTDSIHVVEGCKRWRSIWRSNGWKRIVANPCARRRPIPDMEIWQQLDILMDRYPHLTVEWCKGHAGAVGNEVADMLARQAASSPSALCRSGSPAP